MFNPVQTHYQNHPYPIYPLFASVRRCDTYALNLHTLWTRFNNHMPPPEAERILLAGCGTFAPYPWSIANPGIPITALDLSAASLRRARWHCLLHGRNNVFFRCADLLNQEAIDGKFGLIDSYGVLHHLEDPLAGLKILENRLVPGGILRIMLYSRYARREEESIRRAFKLLGVRTTREARHILGRARADSRLARYLTATDETATDSGIADALLHPCVRTYRIDDLLALLRQTTLVPLLFAHPGAVENVEEEIIRIRSLEGRYRSPGNFVLYLGTRPADSQKQAANNKVVMLNPCLKSVVGLFTAGTVHVPDRIGCGITKLGHRERMFLRKFIRPVPVSTISDDVKAAIAVYKRRLLLLEYYS